MKTEQRKSIFIVVPSLGIGGQEKMAINTAEALMNNYRVTVVYFHPDEFEQEYQTFCPKVNLNVPSGKSAVSKIVNTLKRAIKLKRLVRSYNTDTVFSFGKTANLTNALCCGKHKKVVSIRGYKSVGISAISRWVYSRAAKIVCCSREIKNYIIRLYPVLSDKTVYLPNCYNVTKILGLGSAPVTDYTLNTHTIISHGRLENVKNYARLIRAFSIVKNTVDDAQLLILGDGSQKENLQRLTECLNVQDSVTLAGVRENPFSYLAKASLYVLSSLSEGFPNSLVEGMIFLPVVATDCKSGPREILSNGSLDVVAKDIEEAEYGILVKPVEKNSDSPDVTSDDEILAKAIITLLTDKDKAEHYKAAARIRAAEFSIDSYRDKLETILNDDTDVELQNR